MALVGSSTTRIQAKTLEDAKPDLVISAAHEHVIGRRARAAARIGAIGLHPSLLPRYRGSWPLWWALRAREREAGLTAYLLDDGIDTGPVLAQRRVPIEARDSFASLYARIGDEVVPLLGELIDHIRATGALPPGEPQDETIATTFRTPGWSARLSMKLRR